MALIRFQDKVPYEYVDKSRDFQLLCRLYDVLINGVKYDIDGIERLVNTHECKSNILQLLQTKLGFFTPKNYTDTSLRTILECFPFLVKRKGTRVAIEETVYMYLKIIGLETEIKVDIINDTPTKEQLRLYGSRITDHSVVIGIESLQQDVTLLKDVLRYIIPFGYNVFFYFFVNSSTDDYYTHSERAQIVLVSNDINSALMGGVPVTDKTYTRPEYNAVHQIIPEREEHPYSKYWDSETKQYKNEPSQSMISTINMIEAGVSESIEIDTKKEPWKITKQSILSEEKDITE